MTDRHIRWHSLKSGSRSSRAMLVGLAAILLLQVGANAQTPVRAVTDTPVLAYYYIWFTPDSWNRAKLDIPLLGTYSSDDETTMRSHVQWAKAAGIDGFIVSWKNSETLSSRLAMLVRIAGEEDFKLSIIYEALDFWRHPQPTDKINSDLDYFTETYGNNPVFDMFGKPVVIWSGTWKYDRTEIGNVTDIHRERLQILGSEKKPEAYLKIADLIDGNAYYWSSVDPSTFPDYAGKLDRMSSVVHDNGGLWIAPVAPGFDARHLGGIKDVPRNDGETLATQLETAVSSSPDAIGLISWNEFSENSHVEPSCLYGDAYLAHIAQLLGGTATRVKLECDENALAMALAGSVVATPASTPVASALPPNDATFDWDSSAPGGSTDRSARVGIFVLIGSIFGLMTISVFQVGRRAVRQQRTESGHRRPGGDVLGHAPNTNEGRAQ